MAVSDTSANINTDDIVVAAAAKGSTLSETPMIKRKPAENIIPCGRQLARTPHIKADQVSILLNLFLAQ